jgi:hypothetical protein
MIMLGIYEMAPEKKAAFSHSYLLLLLDVTVALADDCNQQVEHDDHDKDHEHEEEQDRLRLGVVIQTKETQHSFLEFSLCLSRACLGKMIHFMHKWHKSGVSLPERSDH